MKAQSISINTIIVATIALLVLIVIVFMFNRFTGDWDDDTGNCKAVSGNCETDKGASCPTGEVPHAFASCGEDSGKKCCVPLGGDE